MNKQIVFNVSQTATLQDDSVKTFSTLEAALTEMVNQYNSPEYTAVINLSNAEETITKRWEGLKFNICLNGNSTDNTKPKIYFSHGINDLKASGYKYDDAIFAFEGTAEKRIEVKISNIEFMPLGITPNNQGASQLIKYPGSGNNAPEPPATEPDKYLYGHTYLLKVFWGKAVELDNVVSTLKNGAATNLDMRICDNVRIENCTFINYNALDVTNNNRTGCIIQLQGSTHGVKITNNTFYKYGNDEIIALFGINNIYPEYKGFIPKDLEKNVVRKDVIIASNKFVYHKATPELSQTEGSIELSPAASDSEQPTNNFWDTADVLITFSSEQQGTYWENLLFANNTFTINYLVSQVVKVAGFDYAADMLNFRITGNKITHYYSFPYADAQIQDFRLVSYKTQTNDGTTKYPSVEIADNEVIAKEHLEQTWGGHCNVFLNGASALVHDNIFNGTAFRFPTGDTGQTVGIIPIKVRGLSCTLTFENNIVKGMSYLASIEMKNIESNHYVDMNIRGNSFDGYTTIYFTESRKKFDGPIFIPNNYYVMGRWQIVDNSYNTKSYYLITNGFPMHGSMKVSGNVYTRSDETSETKAGVELFYNIPHTLDEFVFTNNVITGDIYMTSVNPPAAKVVAINGNSLGEK